MTRSLAALLWTMLVLACAPAFAADIGFEEVSISNGTEPPLNAGIWYPAASQAHGAAMAGRRLALVVMSHGGGGSYEGHADTAKALAGAGFVAAAVSHAGDTFDDQSRVLQLWRRPAQLRRLTDYMLDEWPGHGRIDRTRVGAFGFSNGGFTVLVAAGGVPELSRIVPYCQSHPDHDLCAALERAGVEPPTGTQVPAGAWLADPRIKAVVVAAPAFGFAFDRAGLSGVQASVQLWRAAVDRHQPQPDYEEAVRAALPRPPQYHVVPNAGHYDFLPPCGQRMARAVPAVCTSLPGFDRSVFHDRFNREVVQFFRKTLKSK